MEKRTQMRQVVRLFIAVPIPDGVVDFLGEVQARLKLPGMNFRWVKAKNIHLTLKFLGAIDRSRVSAVAAQMDAAAALTTPFWLNAGRVGAFPNLRRARVLWVGLDGGREGLTAIQEALETGLASIGFSRDARCFHPHLTIGRTRWRIDAQTISASLESLKGAASDAFLVDRLNLYKSDLKPAGAEYTRLHTSYLEDLDDHFTG